MKDYKIKEFKQPNTEEATKLILSEDITRSVVVENTEAYYSERYGWTLRKVEKDNAQSCVAQGYTGSGISSFQILVLTYHKA